MATSNEKISDAITRHQIYTVSYSDHLSAELVKALRSTDDQVSRVVSYYVLKLQGKPLHLKPARKLLRDFAAEIQAIRAVPWATAKTILSDELKEFAKLETQFLSQVVRDALPVVLSPSLPPTSELYKLVDHSIFEGATLAQHITSAAASDVSRIVKTTRNGISAKLPSDQILQSVIGSAAMKYKDGVVRQAWNNAETLVYTATTNSATQATTEFSKENQWFIKQEVFRATLDANTTAPCILNSNKIFDVGKGPEPPLHYNCRSRRVPVVSDDSLGPQAFDPSTERTLLKEFAQQNNLGPITKRDNLPYGTKGEFDKWARGRRRELIGQVPDTVTYGQFLRRQSAAFQAEVLGVERAKLFRANKLPITKFINRRGQFYTLEQLAAKGIQ